MENRCRKAFINNDSLLIRGFELERHIIKQTECLQASDDSKPVQNWDSLNEMDQAWIHVVVDFRSCPAIWYWAKPGPNRKAEVFFLQQDCQEESCGHIVQWLQKKLSRQVRGAAKGWH